MTQAEIEAADNNALRRRLAVLRVGPSSSLNDFGDNLDEAKAIHREFALRMQAFFKTRVISSHHSGDWMTGPRNALQSTS
jgi:hypothetical protein